MEYDFVVGRLNDITLEYESLRSGLEKNAVEDFGKLSGEFEEMARILHLDFPEENDGERVPLYLSRQMEVICGKVEEKVRLGYVLLQYKLLMFWLGNLF